MGGEELWRIEDERRRRLGLRTLERPRLATSPEPVAARTGHAGSTADDVVSSGVEHPSRAAGGALWAEPNETSGGLQEGGLRIENLKVERGGRLILDIPELFFPAGAITGVMGANGIGKTTLARAVCGLQRARRGVRISLDGKELATGQAFLVMQDVHRQLFAESVSQEAGLPQLKRLDLADLADRHPLSLSGGQKQRLVIATAIDQDARVLILDEPTSGVDHRHLVAIAAELRDLAREGRVVIVISHDIEFLNECTDHVIEIE